MNRDLKISVVVVTYNGREYLPDCFNSLKRQTFLPNQIIVIDNASKDGSIKYLEKVFPEVDLIINKKNVFFAPANNQGIEIAFQNQADYIFLLNQDTVLENNCLEKLAQVAEEQKSNNIFAWQPLILCWPKKDLIQTAGDKMHFLGFGFCGDYKKPVSHFLKNLIDPYPRLTYGSGAGLFIKADILKKIGFFDKDLFLYHEDLDLCLRARMMGYQIKLNSQACLYHKYTEGIPKYRWYWSERNRLLTLIKFYKLPTLILIFPAWLFMEFGVLAFSLVTGWFHLKIKSYISFFIELPRTLNKRMKIQRKRKITDKELAKSLEERFDFVGFTHPLIKNIVNPVLGFYWRWVKKIIFW